MPKKRLITRTAFDKEAGIPSCNREIFDHGEVVHIVVGNAFAVEVWVKTIAKASKSKVDWHYTGGRAHVLHLGDRASLRRVERAIQAHPFAPTAATSILYCISKSPADAIGALARGDEMHVDEDLDEIKKLHDPKGNDLIVKLSITATVEVAEDALHKLAVDRGREAFLKGQKP